VSNDPEVLFQHLAEILEYDDGPRGPETAIGAGVMNSLRTIEIIAVIDEMYGVTVPSDELVSCSTFGSVLALVRASVDEQSDGQWRDG
jgi:acyl carrier protein